MLRFIFKNGNRTVSAASVASSPSCERICMEFVKALKSLQCSEHGDGCFATVLWDVASENEEWQIINSCCTEYKHMIESAPMLIKNEYSNMISEE